MAIQKATKDQTPHLADLQASVLPRISGYGQLLHTIRESAKEKPLLKIIAIDPGITNVAIVFIDREYGTEFSSKIAIPDGIDDSARYLYLKAVVEHWVWMFRPEVIFKESVAFGTEFGVADSGKFQYLIEDVAFNRNIACFTVPNTAMRSFMECKGGEATKSEMKLKVFQKYSKEFPTEDETDAFAIGMTGIAILDGTYEQFKDAKKTAKKKK